MGLEEKKNIRCVYLLPYYDGDIKSLIDTIDSILYYDKGSFKIVCVNDCQKNENLEFVGKKFSDNDCIIDFIPKYDLSWPRNGYGPLFCKLYQAVEYAMGRYCFKYLMKLDTDALMTGGKIFDYLDGYFSSHTQKIGLLGSYRIKCDGIKRTRWRWALYLFFLAFFTGKIRRNSMLWSECLPRAWDNGYRIGESMLGGAYICTYKYLKEMTERYPYKRLSDDYLQNTKIGEDVLFSLLAYAVGYKIADFATPSDPLAIGHKNLPLSKEVILEEEKQIIHSVKEGRDGETEDDLRAFFKTSRK